jgi:hypothetical protein
MSIPFSFHLVVSVHIQSLVPGSPYSQHAWHSMSLAGLNESRGCSSPERDRKLNAFFLLTIACSTSFRRLWSKSGYSFKFPRIQLNNLRQLPHNEFLICCWVYFECPQTRITNCQREFALSNRIPSVRVSFEADSGPFYILIMSVGCGNKN